jgi:bla regulator protein blaR1
MDHFVAIFKEILYLGATASILIFLILLTKRLFKKTMSPKWHYYIWILLCIRLLVPVTPESSFSVYTLFYTAAEKINIPVNVIGNPLQENILNESAESEITDQSQTAGGNGVNSANSGTTDLVSIDSKDESVGTDVSKYNKLMAIMAFLWLFVVLVLTLYTIYINITFAVKVKKSYTRLKDERINGILRSCMDRMNIRKRIILLTTKSLRTPSLYVIFKPKILVSKSYMDQLSDEEIEYIFLHELSHYKRKDIWVNWILALLQIVYFFNPLIWYAFNKIHEECEISCDAAALKYIKEEDYQSYGNTIIKLIKLFSETNFIPATAGISKNKSSYRRRIIMISKYKKSKWTSTLLTVLLIMTIAAVGLTGCKKSTNETVANTADSSENTTTTEETLTTEGATTSEPESTEVNSEDQSNSNQDQNTDDTTDNTQGEFKPSDNTQSSSNTAEQGQSFIADEGTSYYGEWVINKVLAYGGAGTYSKEVAESIVGKGLSFTKDQATSFGDDPTYIEKVVSKPVYSETVLTSGDFVSNYHMTFDNLGIKADSVTEISVADADGAVYSFLVKDENTLILIGGGTYFELTKKGQ